MRLGVGGWGGQDEVSRSWASTRGAVGKCDGSEDRCQAPRGSGMGVWMNRGALKLVEVFFRWDVVWAAEWQGGWVVASGVSWV